MHVDAVYSSNLLEGVAGTEQTLEAMAALVRRDAQDLTIRQHAQEIVANCGGHDFDCEINALFLYCRDQITYRRDPVEQERVQDAARTLFTFGTGDCDDKCVCLATLLAVLGHKSRFVVIGPSSRKYTHVYLEVFSRGQWLPLDPTPEQASIGWETRANQRAVYEIFHDEQASNILPLIILAVALYYLTR